MNKFPKLHKTDLAQELYTPPEDSKKILKFIPKEWTIYEACWGQGHMATAFQEEGYAVVGGEGIDFFMHDCGLFSNSTENYDVIITNPPWRNHKDFIEKAMRTGKPFAFLIRLEHIGGVRAFELFKDLHIQIVIPKKRINFITPKMREGKKVAGAPIHSAWLTFGLDLPKDILYIE